MTAELEEERQFLLDSLRDLERERAEGELDEADYEVLREDYTARAATVLHALEHGEEVPTGVNARPRRHRVVIAVGAVLAVAAMAGAVVADLLGQRVPGQGGSGSVRGGPAQQLAQAHR